MIDRLFVHTMKCKPMFVKTCIRNRLRFGVNRMHRLLHVMARSVVSNGATPAQAPLLRFSGKTAGRCTQLRHYRMQMYTPCWDFQSAVIKVNEKRFHESPEGVWYCVRYIDTVANLAPEIRDDFPLIVGLPGLPGSHEDLMDLMRPFVSEGMRVVILNFPGGDFVKSGKLYGDSFRPDNDETHFFTHTATERALFVVGFLEGLGFKQIDLAVGHSNGTTPLLLLMNSSPIFKSAMFINAAPVQCLSKLAKPALFSKMVMMWDLEPGIHRLPLDAMTRMILKSAKLRKYPPEQRIAAVQAALGSSGEHLIEQSRRFDDRSTIPFSFIYTSADPMVKARDYAAYAQLLGIGRENTILMKPGMDASLLEMSHKRRAMVFNMKSHYPHFNDSVKQYLRNECIRLMSQSLTDSAVLSNRQHKPESPTNFVSVT